jgi:hypothetical protein
MVISNFNPLSILPDDGRVAYSVDEVGAMLDLSKSTVLRRVDSGAFPSIRSEGRRLILKTGLAKHLAELSAAAKSAETTPAKRTSRMNPFERHGIDHLSVSQLALWAAAPGVWVMERLLDHKTPAGAAAHRGTAVEAAVVACLCGLALEAALEIANATFTKLTVFSADPRRDRERDALADMVRQGVMLLAPWGVPDRTQSEKRWHIEGVEVPVIGYSDLEYDRHGLIVDMKTSFALPNEIKTKHARQVASYARASSNFAGAVAYITPRKHALYQVECVDQHILALSRMALSLRRFLALSDDAQELAALLSIDPDSFYLADPRARQAAREVFGV